MKSKQPLLIVILLLVVLAIGLYVSITQPPTDGYKSDASIFNQSNSTVKN